MCLYIDRFGPRRATPANYHGDIEVWAVIAFRDHSWSRGAAVAPGGRAGPVRADIVPVERFIMEQEPRNIAGPSESSILVLDHGTT